MKFYLISDNVDTEMGLRLVGIEGEVVHKRRDFLEVLETKMKDRSIGVILITTKLIELAPDVISEIKLKQQKPLLVEIPDRHGNSKIGETIDRYVSEAIGVKLYFLTASSLATMVNEAPSLIPEALPAVTVPSALKAGRNLANFSKLVLRGCSSVSNTTSPLRVL